MTDWKNLIVQSEELENDARIIQSDGLLNIVKVEEVGDALKKFALDYYDWYGQCLSVLPDDLKIKFRSSYEGDGYAAPCIKKFLENPLSQQKTYPDGRRGKSVYLFRYPFESFFFNPLQSQRQLLIEANKHQEKLYTLSDAVSKVELLAQRFGLIARAC